MSHSCLLVGRAATCCTVTGWTRCLSRKESIAITPTQQMGDQATWEQNLQSEDLNPHPSEPQGRQAAYVSCQVQWQA